MQKILIEWPIAILIHNISNSLQFRLVKRLLGIYFFLSKFRLKCIVFELVVGTVRFIRFDYSFS